MKMWLPHQQSTLTELFQAALVKLCSENIQFDGRLELDGLVCITNGDISRPLVVKIHRVIEPKSAAPRVSPVPVGQSLLKPQHELLFFGGKSAFERDPNSRSIDSELSNRNLRFGSGSMLAQTVRARDDTCAAISFAAGGRIGTDVSPDKEINRLTPARHDYRNSYGAFAKAGNSPDFATLRSGIVRNSLQDLEATNGQKVVTRVSTNASPSVLFKQQPQLSHAITLSESQISARQAVAANIAAMPVLRNMAKRKSPEQDKLDDRAVKREYVDYGETALNLCKTPERGTRFDPTCSERKGPTACHLCKEPCSGRALETHLRDTHKRFLCRICFNTFTLSCNLRRHMKLHNGVRPHACEHCNAAFSRSTDLRIHMKKHVGIDGTSGSDTGMTPAKSGAKDGGVGCGAPGTGLCCKCYVCLKGFDNWPTLTRHLRRSHRVNASCIVSCQICAESFGVQTELLEHHKSHENAVTIHSTASNSSFNEDNNNDDHDETDDDDVDDDTVPSMQQLCPSSPHSKYNIEEDRNGILMKLDNNNEGDCGVKNCDTGECRDRVKGVICEVDERSEMSFENNNLQMFCEISGSKLNSSTNSSSGSQDDRSCSVSTDPSSEIQRDSVPVISVKAEAAQDNDKDTKKIYNNSDSLSPSKSPMRVEIISSKVVTSPSSSGASTRSKRKGMPMKCVDAAVVNNSINNDEDDDDVQQKVNSLPQKANEGSDVEMALDLKLDVKMGFGSENGDVIDESCIDPVPLSGNSEREESQDDKVYTCRYGGCSTSWFGYTAYERHYSAAHFRYPCAVCDQSFTSRNNRRRHAISHTDAKRHPCETCLKLFARPDIVKEHRLTHTLSYQTGKCRICTFTCDKKVTLLSHLKKCFRAAEDIDADIPQRD